MFSPQSSQKQKVHARIGRAICKQRGSWATRYVKLPRPLTLLCLRRKTTIWRKKSKQKARTRRRPSTTAVPPTWKKWRIMRRKRKSSQTRTLCRSSTMWRNRMKQREWEFFKNVLNDLLHVGFASMTCQCGMFYFWHHNLKKLEL